MAYNPTQAPAHLETFDDLRKWIEEELRNLAQNYADDTKALEDGTGGVAADLAALDARVTAAESDIADNTTDIATNTSDISTLDTRVDLGDDFSSSSGTVQSMTNATPAAILSESIAAGTWDLYAQVAFGSGGGTASTDRYVKISSTSADVSNVPPASYFERRPSSLDWNDTVYVGPLRVTLGGTTTYYVNAQSNHSGGTGITGQAFLQARRVIT